MDKKTEVKNKRSKPKMTNSEATKIGTATLSEAKSFRQGYEVACWYDAVLCQPQTVDVFGEVDKDGRLKDTSICYAFSGVIEDEYKAPLLCGVAVSAGRKDNIGRKADYTCRPYAHALAHAILEGKKTNIVLDGFEARYVDFISYDGQPCRTAGIFKI